MATRAGWDVPGRALPSKPRAERPPATRRETRDTPLTVPPKSLGERLTDPKKPLLDCLMRTLETVLCWSE
jgi:hypothetical protein